MKLDTSAETGAKVVQIRGTSRSTEGLVMASKGETKPVFGPVARKIPRVARLQGVGAGKDPSRRVAGPGPSRPRRDEGERRPGSRQWAWPENRLTLDPRCYPDRSMQQSQPTALGVRNFTDNLLILCRMMRQPATPGERRSRQLMQQPVAV